MTFVMVEMIQKRLVHHLVKFNAETFIVKPDAQLAAEGNQLRRGFRTNPDELVDENLEFPQEFLFGNL